MTTHLPECWTTDPSDPPAWCICDELRACEERMLAKYIAAVDARIRPTLHPLENAGIGKALAALRAGGEAMTHDPLCPCKPQVIGHGSTSGDVQAAAPAVACQCELIAKVRQDERINWLGTRVRELKPYADGYCDGERDMLARCITVVDEIIPDDSDSGSWESTISAAWLRHAVSRLRDLQGKP